MIYAHVAIQTGWTWEHIGQHLTIPRLKTLARYWDQHPPAGHLLQARYGYKPKKPMASAEQPKTFEDFIKDVMGANPDAVLIQQEPKR